MDRRELPILAARRSVNVPPGGGAIAWPAEPTHQVPTGSGWGSGYVAVAPPSTPITWPDIHAASSDSRKQIVRATSAAEPSRRRG